MTLDPGTIATDPRFDSDPIAFFDHLSERYGYEEASRVWSAACNFFDLMTRPEGDN